MINCNDYCYLSRIQNQPLLHWLSQIVNMELLNSEEIHSICESIQGSPKAIDWSIENYSDELIGYLGEHLSLKIDAESKSGRSQLKLFVKCMPRADQWLKDYLNELSFFKKEYVMLSNLFKHFKSYEEPRKWRPKLYFIREDLFVFEDVAGLGYRMPCHQYILSYEQIMATVKTIAQFHAQSFVFEEKKSKELNRVYSIWEDYSQYLQEPPQGKTWRDTGRNAVIDYLKVYSSYKNEPNFAKKLEVVIHNRFQEALTLMEPSRAYRNAVVHRDLWTNNIFMKQLDNGKFHALLVDFQTVLYASPMLDISSLLFFNTTRAFRNEHTTEILRCYYEVLASELSSEGIDVEAVFSEAILTEAYESSVTFGITQAAIIVPIVAMDGGTRKELFKNPETSARINTVTRSAEFIEIARHDENYRNRVTELLDEIVYRFIYSEKAT